MIDTTRQAGAQPQEAFCETTGLSYLTTGTGGPAIVLLHGWSAFKELWWSTLIALAPHARAFALDMPGHGGSALRGGGRMDQVALQIDRFCAVHNLTSVVLVGHSMGGNVALELTLARPDLVRSLVLVDPAVQSLKLLASTRPYLGSARGWAALRASMTVARQLGRVGRRVPHRHGGGFVWPALRRVAYWGNHDAEALRRLLDNLLSSPVETRLAEIAVPTLVISGEFDPLIPPLLSQRVAEAIPNARYALVRRAGHNPMDEHPSAFERILLDFLEGMPGAENRG